MGWLIPQRCLKNLVVDLLWGQSDVCALQLASCAVLVGCFQGLKVVPDFPRRSSRQPAECNANTNFKTCLGTPEWFQVHRKGFRQVYVAVECVDSTEHTVGAVSWKFIARLRLVDSRLDLIHFALDPIQQLLLHSLPQTMLHLRITSRYFPWKFNNECRSGDGCAQL